MKIIKIKYLVQSYDILTTNKPISLIIKDLNLKKSIIIYTICTIHKKNSMNSNTFHNKKIIPVSRQMFIWMEWLHVFSLSKAELKSSYRVNLTNWQIPDMISNLTTKSWFRKKRIRQGSYPNHMHNSCTGTFSLIFQQIINPSRKKCTLTWQFRPTGFCERCVWNTSKTSHKEWFHTID